MQSSGLHSSMFGRSLLHVRRTPCGRAPTYLAALCRVSFEDIELLGHWCGAHIVHSYLTGLPLPACLVQAGHFEDAFVMPHGRIQAPQHLLNPIFPGLQENLKYWQVLTHSRCASYTAIHASLTADIPAMKCSQHFDGRLLTRDSVRLQSCAEAGHKNVTAVSVLETLLAGRAVILQDSGFWRQQWPDHELFMRFPALSTPEAREYQYDVMQLHNTAI